MILPIRKRTFYPHATTNLLKSLSILSLLAVLFIHFGCAGTPDRVYVPKGIPIGSGTVLNPAFRVVGFVDIENAQPNDG
jgi:hypothetical protein